MTGQDRSTAATDRRKRWHSGADDEVAKLMRHLNANCWLVPGRDDDRIATARRNEGELRRVYGRLGWSVHIDRDLVRLRKSPPARGEAYASAAPSPQTCSWFFLLVAAADSLPPDVSIGSLVDAARSAAAEAGVESTHDIGERRAIVAAIRMLDERGLIEHVDGVLDSYVSAEDTAVLLHVHHTRLLHTIANPGTLDPAADPERWLAQACDEPDAARRMRRALVDDTCVLASDLDEDEAGWLSQRVRADDGQPLADAFGLVLERRAEGAAFVVPEDAFRYPRELGPWPFPTSGTVGLAALLLSEHAEAHGSLDGAPGPGWRGMTQTNVVEALEAFAREHSTGRGGWSAEYADDSAHLAGKVRELLTAINAVRVIKGMQPTGPGDTGDTGRVWWFAPVTARWSRSGLAAGGRTPGRHRVTRDAAPTTEPDLLEGLV